MKEFHALFRLLLRSTTRRGRVDEFAATDAGDAVFKQQLDALQEALAGPINVVGNASSLFDSSYGLAIDRHPTIRFNSAQKTCGAAQGTRWDIVATSNVKTIDYYNIHVPQFKTLLFMPYYDPFFAYLDRKQFDTPVLIYPMRLSIELMKRLNARPTSGAQVLFLLDYLRAKEINIYGFDWKVSPSYYDAHRKRDPHNHFGERRMFLRKIEDNGWTLNS